MGPANYQRLPETEPEVSGDLGGASMESSLPPQPPQYAPPEGFEPFEIDETVSEPSLRTKASRYFRERLVQPVARAVDPVYQLYCYANAQFEFYVAKMGNPLIVKRLLFIAMVAIALYAVSLSGIAAPVILSESEFVPIETFGEYIHQVVDANRLQTRMEYISSMAHLSGTAGDAALATYINSILNSGVIVPNRDAIFESYHNYPNKPTLELFGPNEESVMKFILTEKIDDNDLASNDEYYYTYAFNPGSKPGKVKSQFIFGNYGLPEDYALLRDKLNLEIKDKIVIIKYGKSLPAHTKLRYAQEHGASGVLFISADDNIDQSPYNKHSIQREPVAFADILPGDIIHPGLAATTSDNESMDGIESDSEKLFEDSIVAPKIPSIPISWNNFDLLMQNSQKASSKAVKLPWGVHIDKDHTIDTFYDENLQLELNNDMIVRPKKQSWNVMGKLSGREQDNFALVIAASRDSVCHGAMEASSTAILMELIDIFSETSISLKWKPLRSIFFVSYSGSKFNMAGSTNYAVKEGDFFRRNAYAVINLDDIITGGDKLNVNADPIFSQIIDSSISDILGKYNNTHIEYTHDQNNRANYHAPLYDTQLALQKFHALPGMSFSLGNGQKYPKNSCLDTFNHFQKNNIDSNMSKHVWMTELISHVALRVVESPIVDYDFESSILAMMNNFVDVMSFIDHLKTESDASDELKNINGQHVVDLLNAMMIISREAAAFENTWNDLTVYGKSLETNLLKVNRIDWNNKLIFFSKVMMAADGIYGDPASVSMFYGRQLNPWVEGPKSSFPGIWNAIDNQDWVAVQGQIDYITDILRNGYNLFQY